MGSPQPASKPEPAAEPRSPAGAPGAPGAPGVQKRKYSNDDTTASGARRYRASRACQYCRTRKVRCDVLRSEADCTNCRLDGRKCVLLASRRGKTEHWLGCPPTVRPCPPASLASSDPARGMSADAAGPEETFSHETTPTALESVSGGDVPVCVTFEGDSEELGKGQQSADHGAATDYTPSESTDVLAFAFHDSTSTTLLHHPSPGGTAPLPAFIAPFRNKIAPEDLDFLARKGAFTVPDPELRAEILKGYIFSVYPFMPLLDIKSFVGAVVGERKDCRISLLLFQAVMFAGLSALDQHALHRLGFDTAKQAREVFFTRVKLLYDFDVESDSTAVFQSLLLMSSWYSEWNEWKDTSYWATQALLVAQTMGLHREPTSACGSAKVQGHRRRMWWSLFIRDRMIALGTRRPMRIQDNDYDVSMLTLDDFDIQPLTEFGDDRSRFFDEEQQRRTALMCIELAKLCICTGHVLKTQYTTLSTKPAVPHTTLIVAKRSGQRAHELKKCDAEIDEWLKQVPENLHRPAAMSQQTGLTCCSDLHWAMLHMTYLTLVSVLHRTQALQPISDAAEAQSIRKASRLKVKDSACKVTKIAQSVMHCNQLRFVGLNMITALLASCLSHMVDIRTGNEDVRDASIFRFDQNMQVLHAMRGVFATADASVAFLASVVKKARLPLPTQVAKPAPGFASTWSESGTYPWASTNGMDGLGGVSTCREPFGAKPYATPPKGMGAASPLTQFYPGSQPAVQPHLAAPLGAGQPSPDSRIPAPGGRPDDVGKEGPPRDLRKFPFNDVLFDNVLNASESEHGVDLEQILYNYDFSLDSFDLPDGPPLGLE